MGRSQVSMKDVAEAAGVSLTTVSDALNGKGRLPAATRERVSGVAQSLGYHVSSSARTLATGRTSLFVLTVSSTPGSPLGVTEVDYFLKLMSGAMSEALEHHYSLVLAPSAQTNQILDRLQPEGAIVVDPVRNDPVLDGLRRRGVSLVTTGRDPEGRDRFWVDNDHRTGVTAMLDHLERAGAARIALLTGPRVNSYTIDAVGAYRRWIRTRRRQPCIETVRGSPTEGAGYAGAMRLLGLAARPDAIYATLDRLALGALLALRANDLDVPNDVLLAAGSDSDAARTADPPLTTLGLAPEAIGQAAVALLIDLVEDRQPAAAQVVLPVRINARASTRRRAVTGR